MAATAFVYPSGVEKHVVHAHFTENDVRVALVTSAYRPRVDRDEFWSDVKAFEAVGTGYVAGGQKLSNKTASSSIDGGLKLMAADLVWKNATLAARYAILYDRTPGTDATRPLLCYLDFGVDKIAATGNFSITWGDGGIMSVKYN